MNSERIILPVLAACVVLLAIAAGCMGTAPTSPKSPTVTVSPAGTTPVSPTDPGTTTAAADNRFAFDLYARLAHEAGSSGNIFFSPYSVSSALAITYEGAKGTTADEIRSVLHFPADNAVRRDGYAAMNAGINTGDPAYALRNANALWVEKTAPLLPEFTTTAERYYGAGATNLDFAGSPENSRLTINAWVANRTEDRIKDLVPAGVIDPWTRLVITNAIYFHGDWVNQFDRNLTKDADFRTGAGRTVKVSMMQRTDEGAMYRYAETSDLQMLVLPYNYTTGHPLSMVVLLPRNDTLTAAEATLTTGTLPALEQSARARQVAVYLPKFVLKTRYNDMAKTLAAMGMPTAFSADADFSGMDGKNDLYISDVIHQAFIDTNEEGTEAAAATAVVLKWESARESPEPVPIFKADHPFVFFIQDNESGAILFMGRVTDPAAA